MFFHAIWPDTGGKARRIQLDEMVFFKDNSGTMTEETTEHSTFWEEVAKSKWGSYISQVERRLHLCGAHARAGQ
jgi:head-tail adaptor